MIKNTFLLLDGVSNRKEKSLWKQGIIDWNSFVSRERINGINKNKKTLKKEFAGLEFGDFVLAVKNFSLFFILKNEDIFL